MVNLGDMTPQGTLLLKLAGGPSARLKHASVRRKLLILDRGRALSCQVDVEVRRALVPLRSWASLV